MAGKEKSQPVKIMGSTFIPRRPTKTGYRAKLGRA